MGNSCLMRRRYSFGAVALSCIALTAAAVRPQAATSQTGPVFGVSDGISGLFGTDHGDARTSDLLNQIFGSLFPAESGSVTSTAVSVLAGHLNLALLAIGGLLFAWSVTSGVLQSAHEGEVLGRRWSSLWAPLRVVFAAALLVPVPGLGGYNSVQVGVAWIVKGSTMMASKFWTSGADLLLSGDLPVSGVQARFDGEVLKTIYRNQLCLKLANHQMAAAGSQRRVRFDEVEANDSVRIISTLGGRNPEICGSYSLPAIPGHLSGGSPAPGLGAEGEFLNLHAGILQQIIEGTTRAIALQWPSILSGEADIPPIGDDLRRMIQAANDRLSAGNRRLIAMASGTGGKNGEARQAIERFIGGEGWVGAGSWHMMLAKVNSELMGLVNASVSATESKYLSENMRRLNREIASGADQRGWFAGLFGNSDVNRHMHVEEAERIWAVANAELDAAALMLAPLGVGLPGKVIEGALPSGPTGLLGRVWQVGFADHAKALVGMLSPSGFGRDPIVGLAAMGNWFLDAAGLLIFGGAAVSLLSGGTGTAVAFMIAAPLAAIGVLLSFIIPMLPFIFWILGVAGYFLLVAEAVVAATLWALMHFRLDGEGISGEAGRQGWQMLLALVLTPSLMILGYFFGMAIYRVVAGLLDAGMHQAMSALVSASPIVGIFGLIAAGFLAVMSHMVIIERSFSLISEFPDRILKWVGASVSVGDGAGERQFRSSASLLGTSASGAVRGIGRFLPSGPKRLASRFSGPA